MSEYDPWLAESDAPLSDDLERVQARFTAASRPYLSSPWSWLAWAVILPGAALATPTAFALGEAPAVLLLWSGAILLGGGVEMSAYVRRSRGGATPLAAWALRAQGNLSLVVTALSALLVWQGLSWALPGLWLLLLGHSLYLLGGLAFPPFRACGLLYQTAGLLALWPRARPLWVFAAATALGNLWIAIAVWRESRSRSDGR